MRISQGQVLVTLRSPTLEHEINSAKLSLKEMEAFAARLSAAAKEQRRSGEAFEQRRRNEISGAIAMLQKQAQENARLARNK